MGLLITFVLGIFVLLGAAIAGFAKNEHRVSELSVAVALGAIVMLLVLDLLPETFEGVEHIGWVLTLVAVIVGFAVLALLDRFLPDSGHGQAWEPTAMTRVTRVTVMSMRRLFPDTHMVARCTSALPW